MYPKHPFGILCYMEVKALIYTLTAVSSITYANKAKRLLNSMGHYCEIEKTPKNLASGCGYSIKTALQYHEIAPILASYGIATKGSITQAGI